MTGQILHLTAPATYGTKTRQRWRIKCQYQSLRSNHLAYTKSLTDNSVNVSTRISTFTPVRKTNKHGSRIGLRTEGHNIKAGDSHNILNTANASYSLSNLIYSLLSLIQRCTFWESNIGKVIALILIWNKGRRNNLIKICSNTADNNNKYYCQLNTANHPGYHPLIA